MKTKAVNQGPGVGAYEGRVLLRGDGHVNAVPLGNVVARNVGGGGPGTGRNLYGQSGFQSQYGASNPGARRQSPQRSLDVANNPKGVRY
jgi:hypothetical protein